jgi:hypothetical protein
VDDEDSNKEGKGGKVMVTAIRVAGDKEGKGNKEGDGVGNKGDVQQRWRWQQQQEQWQQGWWVSDNNKGDGSSNGDGNNLGNGDGNKGGGQQRGPWQGQQG